MQVIRNEQDLTKVDLKSLLPSATVMVIIVTSTTSGGRLLTEEELEKVDAACEALISMDEVKDKLLDYVQSRMSLIAVLLILLTSSQT